MTRHFFLVSLFLMVLAGTAVASVPYVLKGIVSVEKDVVTLNTADGRVFVLEGMSREKLARFDGDNVIVEGVARQADDLEALTVKKIQAAPLDGAEIVLPPYKDHQTPPKLISAEPGQFVIGNVRWGFTKEKD